MFREAPNDQLTYNLQAFVANLSKSLIACFPHERWRLKSYSKVMKLLLPQPDTSVCSYPRACAPCQFGESWCTRWNRNYLSSTSLPWAQSYTHGHGPCRGKCQPALSWVVFKINLRSTRKNRAPPVFFLRAYQAAGALFSLFLLSSEYPDLNNTFQPSANHFPPDLHFHSFGLCHEYKRGISPLPATHVWLYFSF